MFKILTFKNYKCIGSVDLKINVVLFKILFLNNTTFEFHTKNNIEHQEPV